MPDFDELAAGLRRGAATHDDRVRAAVELLIWHETFLRRRDFFEAAIIIQGDAYYVSWDWARRFAIQDAAGVSSSQRAVLELATWIGGDPFGLSRFGRAHRQHAVDALAAALGVTSLSPPPSATPALGARITVVLKAAGFDAAGEVPPFLPAFRISEGVGASVGTDWLDASTEARAEALGRFAEALRADGLRVDVRDGYLYVHDPAREAPDAG